MAASERGDLPSRESFYGDETRNSYRDIAIGKTWSCRAAFNLFDGTSRRSWKLRNQFSEIYIIHAEFPNRRVSRDGAGALKASRMRALGAAYSKAASLIFAAPLPLGAWENGKIDRASIKSAVSGGFRARAARRIIKRFGS